MHTMYGMCVQIIISIDRKPGNPYLIYLATITYEAGFILMTVLLNQIIISFVYLIKLLLYIETKESIGYDADGVFFSHKDSHQRRTATDIGIHTSIISSTNMCLVTKVLYLLHIHQYPKYFIILFCVVLIPSYNAIKLLNNDINKPQTFHTYS